MIHLITLIIINNFLQEISPGPKNESTQFITSYAVYTHSDPDDIIQSIAIELGGRLIVRLTGNLGFATLSATIQDDGGTSNNGEDNSIHVPFYILYTDLIFKNSFEIANNY